MNIRKVIFFKKLSKIRNKHLEWSRFLRKETILPNRSTRFARHVRGGSADAVRYSRDSETTCGIRDRSNGADLPAHPRWGPDCPDPGEARTAPPFRAGKRTYTETQALPAQTLSILLSPSPPCQRAWRMRPGVIGRTSIRTPIAW